MNYENLRNTKYFDWVLKVTNRILGTKKFKTSAELLYWQIKKIEERQFNNDHYEHFYTTYFGLDKDFYSQKRILDIGCGPRGSLEWADNTMERYGLDPLADKYQNMQTRKHGMKYVKGVSEHIPFENEYFDVIMSFNSLDHVDDVGKTIGEITRTLKAGGLFLLIVDIHEEATITEPSAFSWNIMEKFSKDFTVMSEYHYEGHQLYKSIRKAIPFDHSKLKKRYGILTAKLEKVRI